ncbi:signal peptide peptidase SppA [Wenzhouxiangella sp. XN79A]|uniref:signal peptide peptidase SppA n=1 Tax=Wenzhouxiangella sp. XN79A TaxID=2724193 RepID=UPI00144A5A82|nr:signal peptide peptidase SppA [Wenzhouxiangella sp. XN79A]NKI36090.1 signal peptide peptidase SppA [Wenzhouxiangella sp. XN79A]
MTESKQSNFLVRLWRGFWGGVTTLRMFVFNILFLLVLAFLIRGMLSGDRITVEDDTTLVIAPVGLIVEEYTGAPAERAINEALGQQLPETRLRDLLRTLELAADDDRIVQVLLRTDRLLGLSAGTMTELDAAVKRFRESGKPIVAFGSSMTQAQFGLASMADEIWLDPDGLLLIEGISRFRNYYADALELLRVDVNLFRVGEFKSAAEPYIRNDMSEADQEAAEFWIGGLWQQYLELIAANRGLPIERLIEQTQNPVEMVVSANGDPAAAALDAGWVDRLITRPEARIELADRGAPDDDKGFRQIGMDDYLAVPRTPKVPRDRVGIVVASGSIVEGSQSPGMIGGDSTARLLRKAADDDSIKAVVFRIDSGGGSAFASEIIRQEMMALRETGKPVIVSMGDVAASGGYWIAMGADEVWAYPNTITGSIGIFGMFPTFQRTLETVGINTDGFGTTPLAGALRPDLAMSDTVGELFQSVIEHGYREFIGLVGEHRDMTTAEVDEVAQGRVWTGAQARDRGLIDQLGTLDEAIDAAARMAGLSDDYGTLYVEPKMSPFEEFLAQMGAEAMVRAGLDLPTHPIRALFGNALYDQVTGDLTVIAGTRSSRPGMPEVVAHCLCESPL